MSNAKQRRKARVSTGDQIATTRDGFANFNARMGLGADNLLSQGTYTFNMLTRNRMQLEAMYRGSWVVGQAVDAVAEDMTRSGVSIKGEDDPEKIQQLQTALVRLDVWGSLLEGIKWGRLFGGAISVIVIDGQDMSSELKLDTVGKDQFRGLRVYDRWQLQPSIQELIQDGKDAGLPMFYTVISDLDSGKLSNVKIHHTRVVRHIGIQLPHWQAVVEQYWGESVIERLHDRLLSFDTSTAGAANLIQKAYLRTVKIKGLREVFAAGGKAEENLLTMFHHMRAMQTSEGLTLLDSEDEFQAHNYTFSGLSDMLLQFGQQLSGATGIPLVRLFGQSPAGLNSTGENDMRMYYDNIMSQQESRLREGLMKILRVVHKSKLEEDAPENFDFDFVALWQMSAKEKSDISKTTTDSVVASYNSGVIDRATALQELKQSSEHTGIYSNITEEQITEAENEEPPEPVETSVVPGDPAAGLDPDEADPDAAAVAAEALKKASEQKPTATDRFMRIVDWLARK